VSLLVRCVRVRGVLCRLLTLVDDLGMGIVTGVQTWTGRESRALRVAYRLSVRGFAAFLGVGARTVATWEANPAITPRPHMQAILDTALQRASTEVKTRFGALVDDASQAAGGDGVYERRSQHDTAIDAFVASASQMPFPNDGYEAEDQEVQRRRFVQGLATLGMAAPLAGMEHLRHDLLGMVGGEPASLSEWETIAWDYACSYATTPPQDLFTDLTADLFVARTQLSRLRDGAQHDLQRVIAQLGVFLAQTMGNLGNTRASHRWWRFARQAADASGDAQVRVWVRGREVIRSLYEHRPLESILDLADEAAAITNSPGIGTGSVLMGRAQTLAVLGRAHEARQAIEKVHTTVSQLPPQVVNDTSSMYGWPEYRLRHGESFVYTYLGDTEQAAAAQERALGLYPAQLFRERAQVQLHQAMRLVRSGDTVSGVDHAHQALAALPETQRIEVVLEVARSVVNAVSATHQQHASVTELRHLLALPAASERR